MSGAQLSKNYSALHTDVDICMTPPPSPSINLKRKRTTSPEADDDVRTKFTTQPHLPIPITD